jgi:hypothetical protein
MLKYDALLVGIAVAILVAVMAVLIFDPFASQSEAPSIPTVPPREPEVSQ